jgi:coatomer subunit beta
VAVNTALTDLHEYLEHLLKSTNMKSLTPDKAMSGECGFMAANLYAKSIFSEDALANVSLEKNPAKPDAAVTGIFFKKTFFLTEFLNMFFQFSGHIRIRAKSQGMALSLGDKINSSQKTRSKKPIVAQS